MLKFHWLGSTSGFEFNDRAAASAAASAAVGKSL
jgi:hypothetical protein